MYCCAPKALYNHVGGGGVSLLNHHQCAASTWMINKHECMNAWSSTNIMPHLYWRDYIAVSVCTGNENDQLLSDYYSETEEWMVQVHRPSPWHWLTLRRPRCHQRARYLPPSSSPSVCKCLWDHIRYNTSWFNYTFKNIWTYVSWTIKGYLAFYMFNYCEWVNNDRSLIFGCLVELFL